MMKINVAQIQKVIGSRQLFSITISADKMLSNDEHLRLSSDVQITGEVVNTGRLLQLTGLIKTTASHNCNRCLENYTAAMEIPFHESYQQADSEKSSSDTNLDVVYYEGDEFDITDLVHESIVLSEPIKTLCSEECRGLCSTCGTNLNLTKCSCEQNTVDPRLEVLRQLLNEK